MPQMWPMYWELLFISTILLLLVIVSKFVYLVASKTSKINTSEMNYNKKMMKW